MGPYIYQALSLVGASLSEPHIDRDNCPRARGKCVCVCVTVCVSLVPRPSYFAGVENVYTVRACATF